MDLTKPETWTQHSHSWWRQIGVAHVPGPSTPMLGRVATMLIDQLSQWDHKIQASPGTDTDIILTTARFGEPIRWREALLFTTRRRFHLEHPPTLFTLVSVTPEKLAEMIDYFERALSKDPPDPADYAFPGMAPEAFETLYEQGRRGGPMLALLRMVQTQAMSIRVILVVGHDEPIEAYTFDLVGAFPCTKASDRKEFYEDLAGRIVTAASTTEVTAHQVVGEPLSQSVWEQLETPAAMRTAGRELGVRKFFTEMVRVSNLAHVPSLEDAIANQYSEGCFATWDPVLGGLITTITGSARPVDKDNLSDNELAVIVGVRADRKGALVRHVVGKRNDPPSSEAVELIQMDEGLPRIPWTQDGQMNIEVPVARSKLHGHRGVRAYDPRWAEHVYLEEPYYHYPVSCSTEAQAHAIKAAFSRSEALRDPADPRQVVFTVLPGHGIVIVEKWVPAKAPFQVIWEFMDSSIIQIDRLVPQGPLTFLPRSDGLMALQTL